MTYLPSGIFVTAMLIIWQIMLTSLFSINAPEYQEFSVPQGESVKDDLILTCHLGRGKLKSHRLSSSNRFIYTRVEQLVWVPAAGPRCGEERKAAAGEEEGEDTKAAREGRQETRAASQGHLAAAKLGCFPLP